MFLLRKPRVWLAFFVVLSMCGDHERSSVMVTPRYFAAEALSSSTLCRMYLVFRGSTFFGNVEDLAFRGIKLHIPYLFPLFETCQVGL